MNSKAQMSSLPMDVSPTDVKYGAIAFVATMLVPVCYMAVALFFTVLPTAFMHTALITSLAVLIPTGVGYGVARLVGSARAALWTAVLILIAGSALGWVTVLSFRV